MRLIAFLESVAAEEDAVRSDLARIPLRRAVAHPLAQVRSAAFRALLPGWIAELRAIATAKLRDNVAVEGSGGWLAGDGTDLIGRFRDSDFVYARVKYYF